MNKRLNIDVGPIYAVGDIHGCFNAVVAMIKRYGIRDSMIICCGDCGLGFNNPEGDKQLLSKLNKVCRQNNVRIIMVRGNHDNPKFFENGLVNTKYIMAVPDYTVVNGNILCVGGATSIDRTHRLDGKEVSMMHYMKYHPGCTLQEAREKTRDSYWENEAPVYSDNEFKSIKDDGLTINHVITHTCPSFCEPLSKDGIEYWLAKDPGLDEVLNNERVVMDQIYNKLLEDGHDIKTWTYGHYHRHCSQEIGGIRFTMLGAVLSQFDNPDWIEIRN